VRGNDFYTPHFTLPTNSSPTHQPHSILSYPYRTLYFGTKFEPCRTLYFGTEGVNILGNGVIQSTRANTLFQHNAKSLSLASTPLSFPSRWKKLQK
jgi:hypothetical protein